MVGLEVLVAPVKFNLLSVGKLPNKGWEVTVPRRGILFQVDKSGGVSVDGRFPEWCSSPFKPCSHVFVKELCFWRAEPQRSAAARRRTRARSRP